MKILNYGPRIGYFALNPPEADARINILEGAVRSGKTWALHSKILYGCQYPVAGWKVITGVTQGSVYRNVLNDLFSIVGPRNYHYSSTSGFMRLFGTEWVILGAKDEGSEKYIRGLTVGYVVMDEVVLIPQLFFEMMLTRMSPDGARLYGSTNADSPLHWLKTGYIDNEALKASGLVRTIHTTMDDNPNLSQEYKDAQKSIYTGMFYKRFIQGLWVMAEGSIYKDAWGPQAQCDERGAVSARDLAAGVAEIPVTLFNAGGTRERVISVDYGTTNPCVFLDHRDDGKTVWVVNEYRWDSQREMRQKTDKEYAQDMLKFLGPDRRAQILVDPSAASFKAELSQLGLWVTDAKNEVMAGLQKTSSCFKKGVIRLHREKCRETIREIETYAWDSQKALRGIEEPIKSGDHGPDAERYYCQTKIPVWRLA